MIRSALLALVALASAPLGAADTYGIDPTHTAAVFTVGHLGISTTWGRFNDPEGTLVWDAANPAGSKLELTVKTDKVDTFLEKRDQHLRGADFFNTKQFPTATFVSSSWTKTGDNTYDVAGTLTVRGQAKELTVTATKIGEGKDPWGGQRIGFDTVIEFKRQDFGITYGAGTVGDNVKLFVSIEGIKK